MDATRLRRIALHTMLIPQAQLQALKPKTIAWISMSNAVVAKGLDSRMLPATICITVVVAILLSTCSFSIVAVTATPRFLLSVADNAAAPGAFTGATPVADSMLVKTVTEILGADCTVGVNQAIGIFSMVWSC